ncbi:GNAT family N-acetyltransferase [Pseudoalteromonas phenolica]|uniref:Putative acyltransferase n=1 Tax=Pseudoalteromonas phenolica TaxID=161398 RepID=A0A0S2K0L0_9GAMM|nr:GNAT family N-acetyltransferase [Pseudoalteromonas phenolica]ALO41846.1 Putative acyltransferase [Pseudoalteromonas phenolica]MBE0353594.1 ElaA protein [Pseudoalteromonas phenolica O-BC30]RXF00375.1 GNAT family N-acetyltransferase [Pseudoalteromonas phenolica O-BC30]TMO57051.1 GNAT family N-acetyltransferase [Pseudoalteromonas phenolica]
MNWYTKKFSELDTLTFYKLAKARVDIFVVEQACAYPELDDVDILEETQHIYCLDNDGEVVAYSRCYLKASKVTAIGRVIITEQNRGKGLASVLMKESLNVCAKLWPECKVQLSAQTHLAPFYQRLGFKPISDSYLEDGIPHTDMELAQ